MEDRDLLAELRRHVPELDERVALAEAFTGLVRDCAPGRLDPWLQRAEGSADRVATGLSSTGRSECQERSDMGDLRARSLPYIAAYAKLPSTSPKVSGRVLAYPAGHQTSLAPPPVAISVGTRR